MKCKLYPSVTHDRTRTDRVVIYITECIRQTDEDKTTADKWENPISQRVELVLPSFTQADKVSAATKTEGLKRVQTLAKLVSTNLP